MLASARGLIASSTGSTSLRMRLRAKAGSAFDASSRHGSPRRCQLVPHLVPGDVEQRPVEGRRRRRQGRQRVDAARGGEPVQHRLGPVGGGVAGRDRVVAGGRERRPPAARRAGAPRGSGRPRRRRPPRSPARGSWRQNAASASDSAPRSPCATCSPRTSKPSSASTTTSSVESAAAGHHREHRARAPAPPAAAPPRRVRRRAPGRPSSHEARHVRRRQLDVAGVQRIGAAVVAGVARRPPSRRPASASRSSAARPAPPRAVAAAGRRPARRSSGARSTP